MITKGIRGAITVEADNENDIERATVELLGEIVRQNKIETKMISHVIFTLTEDLKAAFPAKFARKNLDWDKVAMMCFHELDVPGSLARCLRVLVVINCEEDFEPGFVYLRGAEKLRS